MGEIKTVKPQSVQSLIEAVEVGETIAIELNGLSPASVRQAIVRICDGNSRAYTTKIFGSAVHVTRHF